LVDDFYKKILGFNTCLDFVFAISTAGQLSDSTGGAARHWCCLGNRLLDDQRQQIRYAGRAFHWKKLSNNFANALLI